MPYHVKLLQAKADVSPVLLWPTVKCKVTTLSHPLAFVNVCVRASVLDVIFVCSYQSKLSQANAVVSPVLLRPTVRCNVTTLSQPDAFVNVCVRASVLDVMFVCSYQSKRSQANAVVSPVLLYPTVKCNVTTLSQPDAFVNVCVKLFVLEVMFVCSYQSKRSQANAVVSPVLLYPTVKCNVTTLSQPDAFVNVCVKLFVLEVMFVCSYQSKRSQANAVVSPVLLWPTVRCNVTTLSQPDAFVNVCVRASVLDVMFVCSYQSKRSQANAVVSPVLLYPTVKCNVTTESQPLALVNVCVKLFVLEVMFVCSYQSKLLQAKAVVSPVLLWPTVKCNVTTESQPEAFVNVCVRASVLDVIFVCSYQSKLLQANAVVSPVLLYPTVNFNVTKLSQPLALLNMCVKLFVLEVILVCSYQSKRSQAKAIVSP